MITRFSQGLPVTMAQRELYYNDQDYTPDLGKLDLIDRHEYMMKLGSQLEEFEKKRVKREEEAQKARNAREAEQKEALEYYRSQKAKKGQNEEPAQQP